jgi:hypothetical protein
VTAPNTLCAAQNEKAQSTRRELVLPRRSRHWRRHKSLCAGRNALVRGETRLVRSATSMVRAIMSFVRGTRSRTSCHENRRHHLDR